MPSVLRCCAQSDGKSNNLDTPKPFGNLPSTAAWTMSGAKMQADNVIVTNRCDRFVLAAICSMLAMRPAIRSSSHDLAVAMADTSLSRVSDGMQSPLASSACKISHLTVRPLGVHWRSIVPLPTSLAASSVNSIRTIVRDTTTFWIAERSRCCEAASNATPASCRSFETVSSITDAETRLIDPASFLAPSIKAREM